MHLITPVRQQYGCSWWWWWCWCCGCCESLSAITKKQQKDNKCTHQNVLRNLYQWHLEKLVRSSSLSYYLWSKLLFFLAKRQPKAVKNIWRHEIVDFLKVNLNSNETRECIYLVNLVLSVILSKKPSLTHMCPYQKLCD